MSKVNNAVVASMFTASSTPVANTVVKDKQGIRPTKSAAELELEQLRAENARLKANGSVKAKPTKAKEIKIVNSPFKGSDQVVFHGNSTSWKGIHLNYAQALELQEYLPEILKAAKTLA